MILDRKCIKCDEDFQLKPTDKSTNICYKCKLEYQNAYSKKHSKVAIECRKENYPLDEYQKKKKFRKIQDELKAIKNRKEWIAYMVDKLDNLEPSILKWIYDRRDADTLNEERDKKIKKEEYEDTRTTHQNESWFD